MYWWRSREPVAPHVSGYPVERYKLVVFVISAVVTGLAGGLTGFQNYLVSGGSGVGAFSGELLAIVVIGGMRSMLDRRSARCSSSCSRAVSIWTPNWLLWFGLIFVAFVLYSPAGWSGSGHAERRWWPAPEESARCPGARFTKACAANS